MEQMIFEEVGSWEDSCQPAMIPDDEMKLGSILQGELEAWKKEAQPGAFGGYRLVLEDGPGLSVSGE
jgi:hypothetical protein